MATSSFTPDEIRAAAEVHAELGPDYRESVVDSFLERVNQEIDARVDARLRSVQAIPAPAPVADRADRQVARTERHARDRSLWLAIASIALGIPLTAIVAGTNNTSGPAEVTILIVIWLAIAVINVAHARHKS
jgi:hypothetical protein